MTERATSRRLTVQEAAEALGNSVEAVRMRVRRGSRDSEKEPDGRVYVWLNDDSSETKHRPNGEPDALISAKDQTIALPLEQLAAEREAKRDNRRIIAGLTSRIPELMPAPDESGQEDAPWPDREPGRQDAGRGTVRGGRRPHRSPRSGPVGAGGSGGR